VETRHKRQNEVVIVVEIESKNNILFTPNSETTAITHVSDSA